MAARERRVHQVAAVRVPLVDGQLVAVLDGATDLVDVGEVDLRVDAAGEQVQAQRHQTHVAGALAVAEQAALDAVGSGLVAQFGCGDGGSAVVVRVQAQDDRVAASQVAAHPLDRVGVDVGRGHLDRGRQVDDERHLRRRCDHVAHGIADLHGVLQFRARVGLRRVLVAPLRVGVLLGFLDALTGAIGGDGLDRIAVGAEHHSALQDRRRVVEVHDRPRRARTRLEGALDQFRPTLGQHLDRHVVGHRALGDDLADEVEVGLAGRREADLDLLVTHANQQVEHPPLARRAHRVDQGLVAVAQVDGTPHRGGLDDLVGPGAIGQGDRLDLFGEGAIPADGHRRRALGVPRRLARVRRARWGGDGAYRREGVGRGFGVAGVVHGSAPDSSGSNSDRRIKNTRDGKPVWIRPRRGVRGGAAAARPSLYR